MITSVNHLTPPSVFFDIFNNYQIRNMADHQTWTDAVAEAASPYSFLDNNGLESTGADLGLNDTPTAIEEWMSSYGEHLLRSQSLMDCINNFDVDFLIPSICPSQSETDAFGAEPQRPQNPGGCEAMGDQWITPDVDLSSLPPCRYQSQSGEEAELSAEDIQEAERLLAEAAEAEDAESRLLVQSPAPESCSTTADSGFLSSGENDSVSNTESCESSPAKQDQGSANNDAEDVKEEEKDASKYRKSEDSYLALIAQALMSSATGRLLLNEIYQHIMDTQPYYRTTKCAWRNSVRHNLSVSECFVKVGRARNGRGFYWAVHPACVPLFRQGDFNRRLARAAVQRSQRCTSAATPASPPVVPGTMMQAAVMYSPEQQTSLQYQPMSSTPVRGHPSFHPYSRTTVLPAAAGYSSSLLNSPDFRFGVTTVCAGAAHVPQYM